MYGSNLINAFDPAEGPPPRSLGAFMRWALSGSWWVLAGAAVISAAAGSLEVVTALILGAVIDTAVDNGPVDFILQNLGLIIQAVLFFVVVRPLVFGLSASANAIVIGPNVNPLVLSRLNRWTLGQNVTFFDDDFAGGGAEYYFRSGDVGAR